MRQLRLVTVFLFLLPCRPAWAMRIVSLLPSNTEILEALGAGPEVIGVTVFDSLDPVKYPGRVSVGDFIQPNLEKIVSLKPDLIFGGEWKSSRAVPRLRAMGLRVIEIPNAHSINDIYESIRTAAREIHRPDASEPVIASMRRRLKEVEKRSAKLPKRYRTYIEVDRGYWTVGGIDFIPEAVRLAGGDNIFADLKKLAMTVSPEAIVKRDPELIICFETKKSEILARPGWATVTAIKNNWVIADLPPESLTRPSPRLVDGIEALEQRLESLAAHP